MVGVAEREEEDGEGGQDDRHVGHHQGVHLNTGCSAIIAPLLYDTERFYSTLRNLFFINGLEIKITLP